MNQKRNDGKKPNFLVPILGVGIVIALGVGIMIGRQSGAPDENSGSGAKSGPAQHPAAPQNKGKTPKQIAQAKNVPEILKDPSGNYQLVSVIESAEANRKLTQNLQVVGTQRRRMLALSQQMERLPAKATAQRKLLAGEVEQTRLILERNLQFMAKSYGYSLRLNYRLVPHAATLMLVTAGEGGTPTTKVAHEFKDPKTYESFQALRADYLLQTIAEAEKQEADAAKGGVISDDPVVDPPATRPAFVPSAELKTMARDLITLYDYDPARDYQVDLNKSALYARQGRKQ